MERVPTHDTPRPPDCFEVALVYVFNLIEEFNLKAKLYHWSLGTLFKGPLLMINGIKLKIYTIFSKRGSQSLSRISEHRARELNIYFNRSISFTSKL